MLERGGRVGDYTLVKFLGRGQFGVVWLAEKEIQFSKRKFRHALKFLPSFGDEANLKLIEAEIDTWIEASGHPNVMSVLDMLVYDDHIVIASEFADGGSLMDWLKKSEGKAPSHEKALEMMTGILSGIEHLHSRSVVHRDLKPDNILLQGNTPRITDFGISRIVSANSMSAVAMGSPFYMSPESFEGGKSSQTDIWSAGVILYEMFTGEHPYRSDSIYGLVSAIRQQEPKQLPPTIPSELRYIVETALQKDLKWRYANAREMRIAIEQQVYNLKSRRRNNAARLARRDEVDPTAITLIDAKIDFATASPVTADRSELRGAQDLEKKAPPTQELAGASSAESFEIETRQIVPIAPAMAVVGTATNDDFKSQLIRWKKPALLFGGLGIFFAVGLVVSLISLVAAARAIFFSDSIGRTRPVPSNSVSADRIPSITPPTGMVYIEGGEFTMGREGGIEEEAPAHKASVGPFFMDIFEVTNEQYDEFVTKTNRRARPQGWTKNGYPEGEGKFPVVGISWRDASDYAAWAEKRLPTEKEWEYAARGPAAFLYPWGNEWKPNLANADGASVRFAEVGTYKGASAFGIYDMVGNAAEWTQDDFKPYENGRLSESYAGKDNLKTVRGNGFDVTKEFATTVHRFGWAAKGADDYRIIGFRCAKDIGR